MDMVALAPFVVMSVITVSIAAGVIVSKIIQYKLKVAQINADASVRTEEVRARNQLEIEKLMIGEQRAQAVDAESDSTTNTVNNRRIREL